MSPAQVESFNGFSKETRKQAEEFFRHPLRAALGTVVVTTAFILLLPTGVSAPALPKNPGKPAIVIAHGVNSAPNEGLPGRLKQLLEDQGYIVLAPQLPLGKGQNIDSWSNVISENVDQINDKDKVFGVGFSGGVQPILKLAHDKKPRYFCGIFGIAGSLRGRAETLYKRFSDPSRIMRNVGNNAGLMHAMDDPILPMRGALDLSEVTGIPILEKDPDGEHFSNLMPGKLESKALKAVSHIQTLLNMC